MEQAYNWLGNYDKLEGYGYFNHKLLGAMLNRGAHITPLVFEQISNWPVQFLTAAGVDVNAPLIFVHTVADVNGNIIAEPLTKLPSRVNMITMYESTAIPNHWVHALDRYCERVLVPSEFCRRVFETQLRAEGYHVPVYLVPGGIDAKDFYPAVQSVDRPYTFMCLGDRGSRKGWDLVWRAFSDEFGESKDVRLIIKSRERNLQEFKSYYTDYRVNVWRTDIRDVAEVYRAADCFVFPSRGEGFGLPPREAAACGIPVVSSNATGLTDGIENWALPISGKFTRVSTELLAGGGEWFEPNLAEIRKQMRWCYEHRTEAHEFALNASKWLHKNCTWESAAEKLCEALSTEITI